MRIVVTVARSTSVQYVVGGDCRAAPPDEMRMAPPGHLLHGPPFGRSVGEEDVKSGAMLVGSSVAAPRHGAGRVAHRRVCGAAKSAQGSTGHFREVARSVFSIWKQLMLLASGPMS